MNWSLALLILAASPPVEVGTLAGNSHQGTLERLDSNGIVVKTDSGEVAVPAAELLNVRMTSPEKPAPVEGAGIDTRLTDGSRIAFNGFLTKGPEVSAVHSVLGPIKFPLNLVQSVRMATPDVKVDAAWDALRNKPSKKDQVVVRKGDVLDHLDGVIGSLDEATLKFQLDGDELPVKRERLFGLIYAARDVPKPKSIAMVNLVTGERLSIATVSLEGDAWKLKLASGINLSAPISAVQSIDFSQGKIVYLSDMEPREAKHVPRIDPSFVWTYERDRNFEGKPISVGKVPYKKGLAIHSYTLLRYRLGGDYRRFQAVMGIDDDPAITGDVDVTIKGDGKTLFRAAVAKYERQPPGNAAPKSPPPPLMSPQPLDLDVTNVVELEIVVDFGQGLDIGDRLHLGDAKVVK